MGLGPKNRFFKFYLFDLKLNSIEATNETALLFKGELLKTKIDCVPAIFRFINYRRRPPPRPARTLPAGFLLLVARTPPPPPPPCSRAPPPPRGGNPPTPSTKIGGGPNRVTSTPSWTLPIAPTRRLPPVDCCLGFFRCFFAPGEGSGSLRPPGAAPSTEMPVGAVRGHFRDPRRPPAAPTRRLPPVDCCLYFCLCSP